MPFHYARDDARRRVRITLTEPITAADLIATTDRQLTDGAWGYGMLVDARTVVMGPSAAEVHALIDHVLPLVAVHGQRGPIATVVKAVGAIAAAQSYAFLADQTESAVEVFWDMQEAERWLDERMAGTGRAPSS